jgi:hypothetical protein
MFVTGNLHHDHDTIAAFRRKFFGFIGSLFAEGRCQFLGRSVALSMSPVSPSVRALSGSSVNIISSQA